MNSAYLAALMAAVKALGSNARAFSENPDIAGLKTGTKAPTGYRYDLAAGVAFSSSPEAQRFFDKMKTLLGSSFLPVVKREIFITEIVFKKEEAASA